MRRMTAGHSLSSDPSWPGKMISTVSHRLTLRMLLKVGSGHPPSVLYCWKCIQVEAPLLEGPFKRNCLSLGCGFSLLEHFGSLIFKLLCLLDLCSNIAEDDLGNVISPFPQLTYIYLLLIPYCLLGLCCAIGERTFEELTAAGSSARSPLCTVCGCTGGVWCSRCRGPRYCGKDHQVLHWKCGHKTECQPAPSEAATGTKGPLPDAAWSEALSSVASGKLLLPELELTIESEAELLEEDGEKDNGSGDEMEMETEEKRLKEYDDFVCSHGNSGALDGSVSTDELTAAASDGVGITDKCFKLFKKQTAVAPDQVRKTVAFDACLSLLVLLALPCES